MIFHCYDEADGLDFFHHLQFSMEHPEWVSMNALP